MFPDVVNVLVAESELLGENESIGFDKCAYFEEDISVIPNNNGEFHHMVKWVYISLKLILECSDSIDYISVCVSIWWEVVIY